MKKEKHKSKECSLCKLEEKTKRYYESKYFVILDCCSCDVPMIVLKRHATRLNPVEMIDLMFVFNWWMSFGSKLDPSVYLDQKRRRIPDHWHCHLR